MRDDDPYFCHLGFPSSLTRKSIRERERNTATTNLRAQSAQRQRKREKENRERTTETESFTLFALEAEMTTGVAEMENIFY